MASVILAEILDTTDREPGRFGGHEFHLGKNAARLGLSWKTLRRALYALARAGMIKGVAAKTQNSQLPLEIIVHPELKAAAGKTTLLAARALGRHFGKLWVQRTAYDFPVQGFKADSLGRWGRWLEGEGGGKESVDNAPTEPIVEQTDIAEDELLNRVKIQDAKLKSVQRKENKTAITAERRAAVDSWVSGAASIWTMYQERRGHGSEGPAWSAQRQQLAPAIARERRELEKMVGVYGGEALAWAWVFFCAGKPVMDEKNRPAFKPEYAHFQWTTPDKKPSHFAKHINLIIHDLQASGWLLDPNTKKVLQGHFGSAFEIKPWAQVFQRTGPVALQGSTDAETV
jgi:hypothetical protein